MAVTTDRRQAAAHHATTRQAPNPEAPSGAAPPTGLTDLGRVSVRRRRRLLPREVRGALGPFSLLAVWALITGAGWVSETVLPSPVAVVTAGWRLLIAGDLLPHLAVSGARAMGGLVIGVSIGATVALIAGLIRPIEDSLDSIMQVLKAIPNFALLPLLIIWFGIGEIPKVTLVVLGTAVPMYINTYAAIRGVDGRLMDLAEVLGLGRWRTITTIVLPGSLPGFLTGLRIAVTNAWLALIFAETINAPWGWAN